MAVPAIRHILENRQIRAPRLLPENYEVQAGCEFWKCRPAPGWRSRGRTRSLLNHRAASPWFQEGWDGVRTSDGAARGESQTIQTQGGNMLLFDRSIRA